MSYTNSSSPHGAVRIIHSSLGSMTPGSQLSTVTIQASGASQHALVRFVILPRHLRPLATGAATVDGVKDDPRAGTCQLLRQMGVGPWRTGRNLPQVVADQRSRHHVTKKAGRQRRHGVAFDLTSGRVGEGAAGQGLGGRLFSIPVNVKRWESPGRTRLT